MSSKWGRDETYHWPSAKPVWTISAFVVGVAAIIGTAVYQVEAGWTPLERYRFRARVGRTRSRCTQSSREQRLPVHRWSGPQKREEFRGC